MKGSKEGTCWVAMKPNPQGPEMRSSKSGMLSSALTGTIVSPTDQSGFYLFDDEYSTASVCTRETYLFATSVVSSLLCSEVHKAEQAVGIWLT